MLRPLRDSKRSAEIIGVFSRFGGGVLLGAIGLGRGDGDATQSLTPARLRAALEELGPVFVKLGQILSTRRDLLGPEWAAELAQLQASVRTLGWDVMSPRIDAALGRPKAEVFAEIDPDPIGSASISQVYRARLHSGADVVVKVTRPGQDEKVAADLALLEMAAAQAERLYPDAARFQPRQMVQELARAIQAELDLREEAANGAEIAANLSEMDNVVIPKVYTDYSSRDLMVQQLIVGLQPRDSDKIAAAGLDGRALAAVGADAFLHMVLIDRVFHADPHPGNLFALPQNAVAFIDFGMIGRLTKARQRDLVALLGAIIGHDPAKLARTLADLGGDGTDPHDTLEGDSARFVARHGGARGLDLSAAVGDLMDIVRNADLALPPDLVLLLKALATADGTMKLLDPGFDTITAARPFVLRAMMARVDPSEVIPKLQTFGSDMLGLAEESPRLVRGALKRVSDGKLRAEIVIPETAALAGALERAGTRIAVAIVVAALAMAMAPQVVVMGPRILGLHLGSWLGCAGVVLGVLWLLGIGLFRRK
ncbi:ABC-1 domain-containing protein (plasmid) [Ketogulonicigenium robustum]|uniref:ABC-1 domain-containing protein n=1 Tax=Ketogulonicigenium robustum TaxID=92947 RepID=A0A1W6P353_9RHOB|nr:AarF/UbiB family protein [Ketogulonicigenium robustum]ARO15932.1 ABC-1 domain-containing protein [Ketogulonicigenium robustum]